MQLPSAGDRFQDKYLIRDALGEGGFATVFRATDLEIQRDVAIKVLAPQDGEYPPGVVARFMVEARVIAGLKDPHTIRLFEFGESADGLLFMVFQYVAGVDLATMLHQRGALAPETAVHIAMQILGALAEAHAINVLHRDIKPANILIHGYMGDEFSAKLLDFGIAKTDSATGGGLTKTGTRLGTPRYMAPEQVFGEPVSPRSDLYSLGLVLFEMLVGRPAIEGDQKAILHHQLSEAPIHVPAHVAWPALRAVVDRMTARELIHRFGTAGEVANALNAALADRRPDPAAVAGVDPRQGSGPIHGPTQRPLPSSGPGSGPGPRPGPTPRESTATARPDPPIEPTVTTKRAARWVPVVSLMLCAVVGGAAYVTSQKEDAPVTRPTALPDGLLKSRAAPTPVPATTPDAASADAGHDTSDADYPILDGCGRDHDPMGGWLDLAFRGRQARVFLPPKYDPNRRYPVIVGLAPRYLSVPSFVKDTQLTRLAKAPFIVIAPAPLSRLDPWEEGPDDIETIRRTIRSAEEQFCVDRSKILVLGHHDGARMAREAACQIPFSGMVLTGFAEKVRVDYCTIDPPIPTMWVVGTDDEFLPIDGGEGCTSGPYLPATGYDAVWKQRNQCDGGEKVWLKKKRSICRTWACDAAPYVSCRADGGHHLGRTDWTILYPTCSNDTLKFELHNATREFFEDFGRALSPQEQRRHQYW